MKSAESLVDMPERAYRVYLVELLRQELNDPKLGAEIGVAVGGTSRVLLREFNSLTLWMVDCWTTFEELHPYRLSGDRRARMTLDQQLGRMQEARNVTAFAGKRAYIVRSKSDRSEERRVGKECRSRW